jgi:hypothetical protein
MIPKYSALLIAFFSTLANGQCPSWDNLSSGFAGQFAVVRALAVFDGHLVAGGDFTTLGNGNPCSRLLNGTVRPGNSSVPDCPMMSTR